MDFDEKELTRRSRPRSIRRSPWKCLGIACGFLTLGIIAFLTFTLASAFQTFARTVRDPHRDLFYNGTSAKKQGSVVGPLIDLETKFDVTITIWRRVPNNETDYAEEYLRAGQDDDDDISEYSPNELAVAGMTQLYPVEVRRMPKQELLWSGVVFEDVTMKDKHLDATIDFRLPLSRFYDRRLYNADVRGSMVLVPKRGSKLDRLESHSDWRPKQIPLVPKMDDRLKDTPALSHADAKQWDALEHIAVSWSLLEFDKGPDPCEGYHSSATTDENGQEESADVKGKEDKEDEEQIDYGFDLDQDDDASDLDLESNSKSKKLKKIGDIHEKLHPYLITRSHLYIMNETRLFERRAYDEKHKILLETACGGALKGDMVNRMLCQGSYGANGHWGNRFLLSGEDDGAGKELAYGPYIGSLQNAAGPRDVLPLPVARFPSCTLDTADPEHIDVTYNVRLSTLSPTRVAILNNYPERTRADYDASEGEKADVHDQWEIQAGLFGDKAKGSHPWRRFIVSLIDCFLEASTSILTLLYWYTRTTTVGLSHTATALIGGGAVLSHLRATISGFRETPEWGARLLGITFTLWSLAPAILQLRLIAPFEIERYGWRFNVRSWKWSHRERASQRQKSQAAPRVWIAAFLAIFSLTYFPARHNFWLVDWLPTTPPILIHEARGIIDSTFLQALLASLTLQGTAMQLYHNQQHGTFAGSYALTANFVTVQNLLRMLYYFPSFIGAVATREGLRYVTVFDMGLQTWAAYQAWKLPRVEQDIAGETEDE
ncbi:hypothetical protein CI109_105209 [Kwoniella shandongensis]|uniref:Uncharacterized protein n=1 Tax=Kwoniella shandongensis TaxID=1734106 RepID=A0A5M6C3C4_9TREE|nr:uncharacterized protein CI109_002051 [Kwoniella shandongensis]KAA5529626.1 hypothetical protein CI109_002051 [Kwoniella shandongensis]